MLALAPLLVAAALAGAPAPAPAAGPVTVLRAKAVLDVKAGTLVEGAVVVVRGKKIEAVGKGVAVPAGAKVVDLGSRVLLPGLIDAHTHLLQTFEPRIGEDDNLLLQLARTGTSKRLMNAVAHAREELDAGVTTVRDLGNSGVDGIQALRDAVAANQVSGPTIVASGRALSAVGGQFGTLTPAARPLIDEEYLVGTGEDEVRRLVRQALYEGADVIKVIVDTPPRVFGERELKAIVEEAHAVGRKVAAHTIQDSAAKAAVAAGVDSIEHGYDLSDATLAAMAKAGTYLVPTDYAMPFWVRFLDGVGGVSEEQKEKARKGMAALVASNKERLGRAAKAGVRVAFGSDWYYRLPDSSRGQASLKPFEAYLESGMAPLAIVRAATINAATLLGREGRVGSLEAEREADVIAVDGDPLKDPSLLQRVSFVMKAGVVVRTPEPPAAGKGSVGAR